MHCVAVQNSLSKSFYPRGALEIIFRSQELLNKNNCIYNAYFFQFWYLSEPLVTSCRTTGLRNTASVRHYFTVYYLLNYIFHLCFLMFFSNILILKNKMFVQTKFKNKKFVYPPPFLSTHKHTHTYTSKSFFKWFNNGLDVFKLNKNKNFTL